MVPRAIRLHDRRGGDIPEKRVGMLIQDGRNRLL